MRLNSAIRRKIIRILCSTTVALLSQNLVHASTPIKVVGNDPAPGKILEIKCKRSKNNWMVFSLFLLNVTPEPKSVLIDPQPKKKGIIYHVEGSTDRGYILNASSQENVRILPPKNSKY